MKKTAVLLLFLFISTGSIFAQNLIEPDPCGFPDTSSSFFKIAASGNWGYGYDTLLYEIGEWKKSPFVKVDSVGATVQNRTMFVLTIQDTTADSTHSRQRIWIHARTHPGEVQGTWVTNEMIKILLSDSTFADTLRRRYIFNIMPMYNPDGVELGYPRENANGIDIEGNWNSPSPQKEVLVLRSQFEKQMAQPNPMRIMLNMHSAIACKRYFVYHDTGGTSFAYSILEQKFINYNRSFFPGGIQPYTFYVSWKTATATQYPESWCWLNHKEKIMALTYEDMNCPSAEKFDSTANAILRGVDAYLQDSTTIVLSTPVFAGIPNQFHLEQNYPNPFNPATIINYQLPVAGHVLLKVYDILGRESATLVNEVKNAGKHSVRFNASSLSAGIYFYRLQSNSESHSKKMILLK